MWSNPIVRCDETGSAVRTMSSAGQRRDAVIQLVSMISIVVQSASTAYQRSDEEGDRVVRTVCELSRQALAELRVWPVGPVGPVDEGLASYVSMLAHVPMPASRNPGYTVASRTREPALPAASTLTPRDMDVMRLIVRGLSNKEIAAVLHLTEGTVKGYVSHLLSKLNVRSRTRAATVAIEQGWV